jgi:hypothetical protein
MSATTQTGAARIRELGVGRRISPTSLDRELTSVVKPHGGGEVP